MTAKEAQDVVNQFGSKLFGLWAGKIKIRVAASQDSVFGPRSIERIGRVKGAYSPTRGYIVLIAPHLRDARDARETIRHETIGHYAYASSLLRLIPIAAQIGFLIAVQVASP
jgi:hypothetical protein